MSFGCAYIVFIWIKSFEIILTIRNTYFVPHLYVIFVEFVNNFYISN